MEAKDTKTYNELTPREGRPASCGCQTARASSRSPRI